MEIKASSSKLKGSVGQIVCYQWTAAPWSWAVAEKSDLKKGLFRKGAPGSRICRLAFCQVVGIASGYSVGHGVPTPMVSECRQQ